MPKPHFLVVALVVLLFSCHNNKPNAIKTGPAFKQSPLDSVYAAIRPAIQTFTINNSKVTRIKATNGTEVLIPAACLVTANGEPVENAQLEIVEAFTLPGFVTSGLSTLSDGKLLISNGMIYINAKAGNENLQLKEGTSLTMSMPTMTSPDGFQLFTGDGSNWTPNDSMTEPDYMIPVPLKLLFPDKNTWFWCCLTNDPHGSPYMIDTSIINLLNPKYENTVIATEEFKQRYWNLFYLTQRMSYILNPEPFEGTDTLAKLNYDLWKVYLAHPERALPASDSIAKKIYIDYFNTNKEKLAAFCETVNAHAKKQHAERTDSIYYLNFSKSPLESYFLQDTYYLTYFGARPLKLINDHGVNLDARDAQDQLAAKGVNNSEINEIITYHVRRQNKIKRLERIPKAEEGRAKMNEVYESTVFTVNKLGWINCDKFYNDPEAGKAQIYVSNNSRNDLDYVDYSLVIPSLNIRLSAYADNNGNFTFTKKEEAVYTKLPLGKDAVITAVSLQHDSLFYASRKIKITDGLNVVLTLKNIKTTALKDSLQAALSN